MRAGRLSVTGGTVETAWWGPEPADAPTIVLLHEGLGCVALWRHVPERLAAVTGWGVFAYSRLGYGQSDAVPLPRPMTYLHDEARVVLPQVLRADGIRSAMLLGHSDGGSIAAIYAAEQAAKTLRGLITLAAHFFVEDLNLASIRQITDSYETTGLRDRLCRYHLDADMTFRGWSDAWLDPCFRAFDITGLLPAIRMPFLALQGANDPYGSAEQLRVLQTYVQAPLTIALIPGARHAPHLEAADATLAAITDFIAALGKPS